LLAAIVGGCHDSELPPKRVLVLGVDGMDPELLQSLIDQGRMPNFSLVAATGTFVPLETSMPPQSPVAWSNVISGAGPGTHEIYDFIHREADPGMGGAVLPYLSTSRVVPPSREWSIPWGRWRVPLFGSSIELLRRGGAFWDDLVAHGIDTTIYRMPANYPPPEVEGHGRFRCLCGMGTPDLMGSYGEFTCFAPDVPPQGRSVSGGRFANLTIRNDRAIATLEGPDNFLLRPDRDGWVPPLTVDVEVVRDPEADVVKIAVGDEVAVLAKGEWSDWLPVEFETGIPGSSVLGAMQLPTSLPAMVRFHVQSVHPDLRLYATPLNIDPLNQVNPVAEPDDFAADIAETSGRYYTTGIPEDTKALRSGGLTEDEFLAQVGELEAERIEQYRTALREFKEAPSGCLFFYFGHIDQLSHIFWRNIDPEHPGRLPEHGDRYATVIEDAYVDMDSRLGEALQVLGPDDTLIVMSDHGFTSFRHGFHLNSWLIDEGYLALRDPAQRRRSSFLQGVNWAGTQAYALGLNALYVNQIGREDMGAVAPGPPRDALLDELEAKLLAVRDGHDRAVIDRVYRVDRYYPGADPEIAPDLLIGYADGYRASWDTAEGAFPPGLFEDNLEHWSGDHCVAHEIVPGILVTNRALGHDDPSLIDLAPTILAEFGIHPPPEMEGRPLFVAEQRTR
jgi:predicted AlkP superfamily phosphohydrolase/phosphomutase